MHSSALGKVVLAHLSPKKQVATNVKATDVLLTKGDLLNIEGILIKK